MISIKISKIMEQSKSYETRPMMLNPEDCYKTMFELFEKDKEVFYSISLNTKNGIIGIHCISVGSLNANIVHPREVFKPAILDSAASIIVAHNHPSGNPEPSKEDIEITHRLREAGKIIGITLLDHVIMGEGRHFSMKEAGHI